MASRERRASDRQPERHVELVERSTTQSRWTTSTSRKRGPRPTTRPRRALRSDCDSLGSAGATTRSTGPNLASTWSKTAAYRATPLGDGGKLPRRGRRSGRIHRYWLESESAAAVQTVKPCHGVERPETERSRSGVASSAAFPVAAEAQHGGAAPQPGAHACPVEQPPAELSAHDRARRRGAHLLLRGFRGHRSSEHRDSRELLTSDGSVTSTAAAGSGSAGTSSSPATALLDHR